MANLSALTIVTINDTDLPVIEFQGMRVLTFKLIDQIHGKKEGTAYENYRSNRQYFIENEDFFEVRSPDFLGDVWEGFGFGRDASRGILITEEGYLLLVKSFNDDLAWQIQRKLKKAYFRTTPIPAPNDKLDYLAAIKSITAMTETLVNTRSQYQRNLLLWHIIKLSERLNQPLPDIKLLGQPVSQADLYLTNFGDSGKEGGK